jgi:hypothetical protein
MSVAKARCHVVRTIAENVQDQIEENFGDWNWGKGGLRNSVTR